MEYKELIKQLNINKDDIVLLCSDIIKLIILFKNNKDIFDSNRFINLIINEIGVNGTLIFPTYNWGYCRGETFDIRNSRSEKRNRKI